MPLAWRLARRELRSGVRGFRIFLACLALGVAAIAAAGGVAEAFRAGVASQAREILGGDIAATVEERQFSPAERAALARLGRVGYAVAARAMAQAPSGERRLVELRGVSAGYPLAGEVELAGGARLAEVLTPRDGVEGAAVEKPLLDRLGLKLGDRFLVGNMPMVARAVLISEPDRLSRGFALGPRMLTRLSAVEAAGFVGPGMPFGETVRIVLPPGENLKRARAAVKRALAPGPLRGGVRIRDRNDAAPGIRRTIEELEYYLGFIGLASLVAGGLGVAGAVGAFLDERKDSIAVLKVMGAEGALVRNIYLIQIGLLAALGVTIGLAVGAATPLILGAAIADSLPVPALFGIYPWPLVEAAAFGLLAAAAFSLGPLARARSTPPAALFRSELASRPRPSPEAVAAGLAALALAGLAIATAPTRVWAAIMIAGVAVAFLALWALGLAAVATAARLRGAARGPARIGLANLAGPGSAARGATPAIGLGVALIAAVVLVQSSLLAQVREVAPRTAPSLVFTDIPGDRGPAFDAAVAAAIGRPLTPRAYLRAPFATGRIVRVRGALVDRGRIDRADRWAYDSDITLSAIGPEPLDAGIVAGKWWPADWSGAPLAAVSTDAAKGARLKVGDAITIAILGREIDVRVAVLRKVDFDGFGANFPLVVDSAALAGADLTDVAIARATRGEEQRVTRALGASFPQVGVISVREALEAAADLIDRLTLAIRAAAAIAVVAGLLVLAGAVAAGARRRAREAAILKVLGATRGQVIGAYAIEYGVAGVIAAAAGVAVGCTAAWPVVTLIFETAWSVDWPAVGVLVVATAALTGAGGLIAALTALAGPPARALRSD